ncbi:carbohydrate ABC transporter permease, partial [Catellatospora sp. NPDC049133]
MTTTDNPAARARRAVLHVVSIAIGALIVVPVGFGVLGGFKDNGQLSTNPLGWPDPWQPGNYTGILADPVFWRQLANSTLIALATVAVVVGASAMA